MAEYLHTVMTDVGQDIFAQTVSGAQLVFTRGAIDDGMPVDVNYRPLTWLVHERLSLQIVNRRFIGNGTM